MGTIIKMPSQAEPDTADWRTLLDMMVKISGSFMLVRFSQSGSQPMILKGSRFEINQSFYECTEDEAIPGWGNIGNNTSIYVYAYPNADVVTFAYSPAEPALDTIKGGLFSDANRCIGMVNKLSPTSWNIQTAAPQWILPWRTTNPIQYGSDGVVRFKLPTLTTAQEASTQDGDMWIRV